MSSISSNFVGLPGGLLMSMIAFSIVFLVIVGLMFMMMALKKFAAAVENRKSAPASSAPAPSASSQTPAAAVTAEDDSELVAVITAAITAMTGTAARIVSIKPAAPRISGSPWRMTGILQNSEGFSD